MHSTVELKLVCKELKALLEDPAVTQEQKHEASRLFKKALWEKMNFPIEVFTWDAVAVRMFVNFIAEAC